MLIGYARVSTQDQTLYLQTDALRNAGCDPDHIYTDTMSGARADRPGLREALSHLRAGDTIVVWKLDRLGRSLKQLIEIINDLGAKEIGFKSLTESMDTTTSGGMMIFQLFGVLAEFERNITRERTNEGLRAARARGRLGGRPKVSSADPKKLDRAKRLYAQGTPVSEICDMVGISKSTLYRNLEKPGHSNQQSAAANTSI